MEILQLLQVILQGLKDYLQELKDFQTRANAFPGIQNYTGCCISPYSFVPINIYSVVSVASTLSRNTCLQYMYSTAYGLLYDDQQRLGAQSVPKQQTVNNKPKYRISQYLVVPLTLVAKLITVFLLNKYLYFISPTTYCGTRL